MANGAVTLGDLRQNGKLLELGCYACRLHLYVDPADIALPAHLAVPAACDFLKCPQWPCGKFRTRISDLDPARRALAKDGRGGRRCLDPIITLTETFDGAKSARPARRGARRDVGHRASAATVKPAMRNRPVDDFEG